MRRPRFGLKLLIILVAILGLTLGTVQMQRRRAKCQECAEIYDGCEHFYLRHAERFRRLSSIPASQIPVWQRDLKTIPADPTADEWRRFTVECLQKAIEDSDRYRSVENVSRIEASRCASKKKHCEYLASHPWLLGPTDKLWADALETYERWSEYNRRDSF